MQIKIENARVHQNVLIFLQLLSVLKKQTRKKSLHHEIHTAFLNRKNGTIFFAEQLPDAEALNQTDWKVVELCCLLDPEDHHLSFELQEHGEKQKAFACEDLTPLAYHVVSETMKTLNDLIRSFKNTDEGLEKWEGIQLQAPPAHVDIIRAAWHEADRWAAEEMLEKRPYGSYLFRRDEYAKILSEQLQGQLNREVQCFTLTFSEPCRKVRDLTIVQDGKRWLIYDDDPSLSGKAHASIDALLDELKSLCTLPLMY